MADETDPRIEQVAELTAVADRIRKRLDQRPTSRTSIRQLLNRIYLSRADAVVVEGSLRALIGMIAPA